MIINNVKYILSTLHALGYEAFIVGGAVRNSYLNIPVNDWDITTNASPDIVEALFDNTYDVGKSFGTIVVSLDQNYEVTTYRTEGEYDGRKPGLVSFSTNVRDDLSRRDFTMNAMIMDIDGNIFDYYNGKQDLKLNIINTVGEPKVRFSEDYLRVYRYVRFTAQYGFNRNVLIDEVIKSLSINHSISVERIRDEFNKILLSKHSSNGIKHLYELGLLESLLPEIIPCVGFNQQSKFHNLTVFDHLLQAVEFSPNDLIIRLAALCHDLGKPATFELIEGEGHFYGHDKLSVDLTNRFLTRMKYSNEIIQQVLTLIKYHMRLLDLDNSKSIKKFMNKIGLNLLNGFLSLRQADILSCNTNDDISSVEKMRVKFDQILNEKHPMNTNDLDINGFDIIALGFTGKKIGEIKNTLLDQVLDDPKLNSKLELEKLIKLLF